MRKNRPQSALLSTEHQPTRWTRFAPLLIVAAGAIVYVNSFEGVFLFDDALHIEENPRIQQLWPVADVLSGRRPAVDFSLAVNYAIGGLDVGGYHAFNLAVHLLAALTLFGVVHRSLRGRRYQDHLGHTAPGLALTIALIWVVHPLQTQSVTYIVQRGESMMGLCYLLTLYCIIRGSDSSRRIIWYGVAVLACVMGLASKAIMITAPLTVLMYDRAFLTKSFREAFRLRWGLYLALVATWGVLALCGVAQGVLDPVERPGTGVGFGYKGVTPGEYLLTQPGVIMHYLRLSIWPHPLCLDYAWPVARSVQEIVLPGLVIIGLLIGTLWALRRRPWLGFAGTWFFLILGPTSSIVPIRDPAFEHRMYLPLAAVVTVLVAAAFSLLGWIFRGSLPGARTPRLITMVLAMAIVIALGARTIRRNRDYHSAFVIWSDVVTQRPDNVRAHCSLGNTLLEQGQADEAIAHYRTSLELKPRYAFAHYNLGRALHQQGEVNEAAEHYTEAVRTDPTFYQAHYRLGVVLADAGHPEEAVDHYRQAVRARPEFSEAHNNLGNELHKLGRIDEAIVAYREALRLNPTDALAHYNLALALEKQGRLDQAITEIRAALQVNPAEPTAGLAVGAHYSLGRLYRRQDKTEEAIAEFQEVLRIQPDHPSAGRALYALRQGREKPNAP